jgi:hypothetical protein
MAIKTYNSINGFGTWGTAPSTPGTALTNFESLISMVIGFITVVGGIYFMFQIFTGAVQWISSGSDKDGVSKAQKKFTNALLGLIILIFAYSLIGIVGTLFGLDLFNFSATVQKIIG